MDALASGIRMTVDDDGDVVVVVTAVGTIEMAVWLLSMVVTVLVLASGSIINDDELHMGLVWFNW